MKLLVTGDWHGDAVTAGYRRAADVEAAVLRTVAYARDAKVDLYAFLGDLTDPDSGSATLRAVEIAMLAAERLNAYGVRNVWVAGNHDVVEDGSGRTTLGPLSRAAFPLTTVFERPGCFELHRRLVCALPFAARSHAYDPPTTVRSFTNLDGVRDDADVYVFLAHLQVEGAKVGSETTDMPRGRDVAFPVEAVKEVPLRRCFNGHYHTRQVIGEVTCPGSLQRLTFGEQNNTPGFLVAEV